MSSFKLRIPKHIFIAFILLLALLVRIWYFPHLFHWTLDEEYWAYLPYNIANGFHFPLIGGHIAGTGLYSGPIFIWLMGIVFWIINGNPIILAFLLILLGVVTTYLIYKFSNEKRTAVIASLLYGTSVLASLYDRKYWNASLSTVLALISMHLLNRLKKKPAVLPAVTLGFIATLAFHAHMTGAVIVFFIFIAWYYLKLSKKLFAWFLVTFLGLQTPILFFELRHDFFNTRALIKLLTQNHAGGAISNKLADVANLVLSTFARLIYTPATDIRNELTLCRDLATKRSIPPMGIYLFALAVLGYILYLILKKRLSLPIILIVSNLLLLVVYRFVANETSWYAGQSAEYYLLPSFGAFFLLFAQLLVKIYKRFPFIALSVLSLVVILNLNTLFHLTHSQNIMFKQDTVKKIIAATGQTPYSLNVTGHPCNLYGYRYLLTFFHHEPSTSYLDPQFAWIYETYLPKISPQKLVTIDANSGSIIVSDLK
jgi:hypothetical protein